MIMKMWRIAGSFLLCSPEGIDSSRFRRVLSFRKMRIVRCAVSLVSCLPKRSFTSSMSHTFSMARRRKMDRLSLVMAS